MAVQIITLAYFLFLSFTTTLAGNGNEETYNLVEKLKSNFNRFAPPHDLINKSVKLYIELFKVLDIDEKQGLINLKMILIVSYGSNSSVWDPEDHGGIEVITIPEHIFWSPPLSNNNLCKFLWDHLIAAVVSHYND